MNSRYHTNRYWIKYGKNPMASFFASEFKHIEDAEAALLSVTSPRKVKHAYFNILDWIGDMWDDLKDWMSRDVEKEEYENYLAQSKDLVDLEQRQREWEKKKFGNRFYI